MKETSTFYIHGEISSQKFTAERSREGKIAKQTEKYCKHIKLSFSTSVFGTVCAINGIDSEIYLSYLLLSVTFHLLLSLPAGQLMV